MEALSKRSDKKVCDSQNTRNPYHNRESCKCGKRIFAKQRVVNQPYCEMSYILNYRNCNDCGNNPVEPTPNVHEGDSADGPLEEGEYIEAVPVGECV